MVGKPHPALPPMYITRSMAQGLKTGSLSHTEQGDQNTLDLLETASLVSLLPIVWVVGGLPWGLFCFTFRNDGCLPSSLPRCWNSSPSAHSYVELKDRNSCLPLSPLPFIVPTQLLGAFPVVDVFM